MKTESLFWKRSRRQLVAMSCWLLAVGGGLLTVGGTLTSCSEYDLDEETPSGWDRSIYSWLKEQGDFTNMVRLIDDLNYTDVLARTGSKTLFAADDAAFERFFSKNNWGVSSYGQLTYAQKRLLLFGAMIDNSYQVQSLASTSNQDGAPIEGNCMRRVSSLSTFDNVSIMKTLPEGPYWQVYADRDSLVVFHDYTEVPMVHFIERFMTNKQITNEDYDFLFNRDKKNSYQSGDASVNGSQIVTQNIRCLNGFINRMSEVVTPLPNMAEIINSESKTTEFAHLLNRFSVLDWLGDDMTDAYNRNFGTNVDSVFQLRYFSKRSQGGATFNKTYNQQSKGFCELPFDPGWNGYYISTNTDDETALQQDMAVMLVPSNDALKAFWETGAGAPLRISFGSWDKVPYNTLKEFMSANMLSSFVGSVPSKFTSIMNDASDPLGITTNDIDSVWLACNGAIYLTNRVFTPTSFISVMYPAKVDQNLNIMDWAIDQLKYSAYLNSLNATYSFFIPSNNALQAYVDPCSYGKPQRQVLRFHYDETRKGKEVYASIHNIDPATGVVSDSIDSYGSTQNPKNKSEGSGLNDNPVLNRLYQILDDHVVIGNVEDGHEYYRTKGGATLHVIDVAKGENGMKVEGSRQYNGESPAVPVAKVYDQTKKTSGGNGKSYILENSLLMGTRYTVFNVLGKHPEFSRFHDLLEGSSLLEMKHDKNYACNDTCIKTFNNYHYTVYVPTNESIDALISEGKLHTWDDMAALDTTIAEQHKLYDQYNDEIETFLRYHIQDNSLYIHGDNTTGLDEFDETGSFVTPYETAYIGKDLKFRRVKVTTDKPGNQIVIEDEVGNHRRVMTEKAGLYNLMAREYVYQEGDKSNAKHIRTTSSAVIHLIDGPLMTKSEK